MTDRTATPLPDFLAFAGDHLKLLEVARAGARNSIKIRRVLEAVDAVITTTSMDLPGDLAGSLAEATDVADAAQLEIDRDFPLLHAHLLVGLWGGLEAAIDDVCLGRIESHPEAVDRAKFEKVRVPLSTVLSISPPLNERW